jgi:hypothetical protein
MCIWPLCDLDLSKADFCKPECVGRRVSMAPERTGASQEPRSTRPTFTELPPESPLMATARRVAERGDKSRCLHIESEQVKNRRES